MNEREQNTVKTPKSVGFRSFWLQVASELGEARLHLDGSAHNLDDFIMDDSDVRIYLHKAIRATYRDSHCQHLDSPISLECVLDTLGETAYKLQNEQVGDLFDIELLEEIAWLICDRYADQVTALLARCDAWQPPEPPDRNSALVISFPDYKIRRANARL
jgi:hypothetical protein